MTDHAEDCPVNDDPTADCTCGLLAYALAHAERIEVEGETLTLQPQEEDSDNA